MSGQRTPVEWMIIPLKKYAQFSGRAPRAEFWWSMLAYLSIGFSLDWIDQLIGSFLGIIFSVGTLVPNISVTFRRLHDTNRTGWWYWLPFIPAVYVGLQSIQSTLVERFEAGEPTPLDLTSLMVLFFACIVVTIFLISPGTTGCNRIGPDPYETLDDLDSAVA